VADDARYGTYTFMTSTEKPREVVLRETLAPIIETTTSENCRVLPAARKNGDYAVGLMLWFIRKKFDGSYLFFRATRRS
jgi:hypothetical protein